MPGTTPLPNPTPGVALPNSGFNANLRWTQDADTAHLVLEGPLGVGAVQVIATGATLEVINSHGGHIGNEQARQALRAAKRTGDVKMQAKILGTLGNIAATSEHFDDAIDYGEKTRSLATALHDESLLQRTEGNLG